MEKLIEYYNEYYQKENLKEYYDYIKDMVLPEKFDSLIFLKDFCKWLVENEKIDVKELEKSDRPFDVGYATEETLYERVLMLLSIQDEPIEFLISILK